MRGLTLKEFEEVIDFVQTNHRFALFILEKDRPRRKAAFPKLKSSHGFGIKYVESWYDTRDKSIWSITFSQGGTGVRFATNHFTALNLPPKGWKYDNLYDLCMDFLTGHFEPKEEFLTKEK
jgi:hypothetical protein